MHVGERQCGTDRLVCASHQLSERQPAIDWEVVGFGAVGEDIGNLIGVSLPNFDVEAPDALAFTESMLDHYGQGLQRVEWRGDLRLVRAAAQAMAAFMVCLLDGGLARSDCSSSRHEYAVYPRE
ncbi:MAG: hypothetical protein MI924_02895 [Chloroflexales bacterium]|nr:hypothetical protein [Chloroflexales bacterium]